MTVKEMHVDVRDQLQRLSAHQNRKIRDEQIDWYLNKTQQGLAESAVVPIEGSGRFRIKAGKTDIVKNLVSGRSTVNAAWIDDRYVSFLPPDFWYLLDDGSSVCQLCTGDIYTSTYQTIHVTCVSFPLSPGFSDYYSSIEVIYNNSTILNLTSILQERQITFTGFTSKQEHFYIATLIQELLLQKGIVVYWEEFYNISKPYTFLFVSDSQVPVVIKLDGTTYTGTHEPRTLELHSGPRKPALTANTMVSSDKGMATQNTPYFKTSYISPMSEMTPTSILTYKDEGFIVSNTTIEYVRKPRQISLTLGTNCQLSPSIHQEVCNATVRLILNRISSPAWESAVEQDAIAKT